LTPSPSRAAGAVDVEVAADRAKLLANVRTMLAHTVDAFVDRFHERLRSQDRPGEVLAWLTEPDLARLKSSQAEHLMALLDPEVDRDEAFARGRRIGRVHAMVGVDIEWYAAVVSSHHQQIFDLVGTLGDAEERTWLYSVVARRLTEDLQAVLAGYRDVDGDLQRAMLRVNDTVATAGTVPDLVLGVLGACTEVDGVAAGFFGRPDAREVFQFEMGVGAGAEAFMAEIARREPLTITVLDDEASGQGPSGRSWRLRSIERSDSYLTDPSTAPWHALGAGLGWRSSVSVPICDRYGEPRALLSFYSYYPGFFATPARQVMLDQVRHLLERALGALEARGGPATAVRPYSTRSSYLARLHRGEVEMIYQPIVDLRTGRPTKVEALARLLGDYRRLLPAEFLPALGDDDLVELFDLGLNQSLDAVRSWDEQGLSIGVALNLPAVDGRHERYVAVVERALAHHRISPSRLTLELLETGHLSGRPRWRSRVLEQLKELGVRLAQDDLGSGHSSLLRLRHFAFDVVKIDQSLVRGQEFDPRGALNFIHPLTSLAHSMGLRVIVEGLENRGLIEAALMLGADGGQGYGISRPLDAGGMPRWARGYRLHLDPERPDTRLGALAAHVAWEQRTYAGRGPDVASLPAEMAGCPLSRYIGEAEDPGGHLAEVHAEVHRSVRQGLGSAEHMRWWRVLTKMLAGSRP
jgi:EAL domain-containing protein (putative c-di-GMP-specific phosphodiesterase class I)